MLCKRKVITIRSRQINNYNRTYKRVNVWGITIYNNYPCEICSGSFLNCWDKVTCRRLYEKFNRHWVYVV